MASHEVKKARFRTRVICELSSVVKITRLIHSCQGLGAIIVIVQKIRMGLSGVKESMTAQSAMESPRTDPARNGLIC